MGSWFGRDPKAYSKWATKTHRPTGRGLTGQALESAVMRVASIFPDNVTRGIGA